MDKHSFIHIDISADPDRDNINDNFTTTTGCLIHSHTLLLQNKIVIAQQNKIVITQQNKIVIVLHGKMQVIDSGI